MNNMFITFLSLSLSGSLLILVLFLCKPFIKNKLSRQWQYYIWIIVIARLLLPFAPIENLMNETFEAIAHKYYSSEIQAARSQPTDYDTEFPVSGERADDLAKSFMQEENTPARHSIQEAFWLLADNYWLIWLVVAAILLIRKITIYRGFVRYVKAGMQPVSSTELLDRVAVIGMKINVSRAVELCVNPLISSPILIGFFRPCIAIPSADLSDRDFHYTILHELTHYRRRDMFYKWLVQITICLHWFNPLVYLMGQEINRACEFACDEALIAKLGPNNAQDYGYTLLESMASAGQYKETLASVSLSENKKLLKERLEAIMSFRNKSKLVSVFSVVLAIIILCGATFTGAYAAENNLKELSTVIPNEILDNNSVTNTENAEMAIATIAGETWYLVETEEQLRSIGSGGYPLSAKYMLNANITLSKTKNWIPIGTFDKPFTGTFNGNGFEIIDLTINDPNVKIIGMFAFANDANICNVILRNPDIESAFQTGDSIAPIVVFGFGSKIYDNQIINGTAIGTDTVDVVNTSSRVGSLTKNFEKYKSFNVIYNAEQDAVYYNGKRVKLFVDFKPYKEEGMIYAFDLCYHDENTDSTLYLEAVKGSDGNITGIRLLNDEIVSDLLESMAKAYPENKSDKADNKSIYVTMDATQIIDSHEIVVKDLTKDKAAENIKTWMEQCDKKQGAYVLKTQSANGYLTYIYYNGGGRHPWDLSVVNDGINANLYSDSGLSTTDGYCLIYFTAPKDYANINLYLDNEKLNIL